MQLLGTQTHVESPFVIVKIGNYTFGQYNKEKASQNIYGYPYKITFPNVVKSLNIKKINGQVNNYTVVLEYGVQAGDDPNMMEKVFGSVAGTRQMVLTYGDWNQPAFIYKEEQAIITKVATDVDFSSSKLKYTITAISNAVTLKSTLWPILGGFTSKPSTEIYRILYDNKYGLLDLFTGMQDKNLVINNKLIPVDDKEVFIDSKYNINILDYLSYLVDCMVCNTNTSNSSIYNSIYHLVYYDDIVEGLEGPYFKIIKIPAYISSDMDSNDVYEVDIGYPTENFVTSFRIDNTDTWSLLYETATSGQQEFSYYMDDKGNVIQDTTPSLFKDEHNQISVTNTNWWTEVTQFPIKATLEIRGLLRPSMLTQYIRVNSYFYGQKYIASGLYIITEQQDAINSSGYKTTLSLLKINSDKESNKYSNFANDYNYSFDENNEDRSYQIKHHYYNYTHTSSSGTTHGGGGRH